MLMYPQLLLAQRQSFVIKFSSFIFSTMHEVSDSK